MSLVISLRVPDGIVVAADSLSTAHQLIEIAIEQQHMQIEEIKHNRINLPPIPVPFSASSYTQKLFPFHGKYSISVVGQGIINNKSAYYHLKQFENTSDPDTSLEDVIENLVSYMERELSVQFPRYDKEAPEEWRPVAFH